MITLCSVSISPSEDLNLGTRGADWMFKYMLSVDGSSRGKTSVGAVCCYAYIRYGDDLLLVNICLPVT
jgi:hypothetical protein